MRHLCNVDDVLYKCAGPGEVRAKTHSCSKICAKFHHEFYLKYPKQTDITTTNTMKTTKSFYGLFTAYVKILLLQYIFYF